MAWVSWFKRLFAFLAGGVVLTQRWFDEKKLGAGL
jgi:hypothetical protein